MHAGHSPPRVFPLSIREKELGRALTLANIAITRKVNASNWIHIDPHLSTFMHNQSRNDRTAPPGRFERGLRPRQLNAKGAGRAARSHSFEGDVSEGGSASPPN